MKTKNNVIEELEKFANGRKQYLGLIGDYYINYDELMKFIQKLK